jgi:hypothetical protein
MEDSISTRNTSLATYLVAKGHRVVRTTEEAGSILFHFIKSPGLSDDVQSLKFGDDLVSARRLFDARAYLLNLIHNDGGFGR